MSLACSAVASPARKVLVVCPGEVVSGGPEVLHQLVDCLRRQGRDAYICYHPFDRTHATPIDYAHYDVVQHPLTDEAHTTVVLPESATKIARHLHRSRVLIWWLSVDNFFAARGESEWADWCRRWASLYTLRLPLRSLRRHGHLAQSHYAAQFLRSHGMVARPLTDYLSAAHVAAGSAGPPSKRDVIAFNPRKGLAVTQRLRQDCPELSFEAIEGLNSAQVRERLASSMVYMDFGHHPGKDRLPREAALSGCCVITGRRGSAAYQEDVGIPDDYKLDERAPGFADRFSKLLHDIRRDFDGHSKRLEPYRQRIRQERAVFEQQVRAIFG